MNSVVDPPGKYDALMNGWNEPSKHGNGNVFAFIPCTEGGGETMTQIKWTLIKCTS